MTGPLKREDLFPMSLDATPLHRILTPDEFHQAQTLSPQALATPGLFPALPPVPKAPAAAPEAPPSPEGVLDALPPFAKDLVKYGVLKAHAVAHSLEYPFEHPLDFALGIARAPVESFLTAVAAPGVGESRPNPNLSKGGNSANAPIGGTYDAEHGGVTNQQRTQAGIQSVANAVAPSLGPLLGGAAAGAAYNPDDPITGAIAGAIFGKTADLAVKGVAGAAKAIKGAPAAAPTAEAQPGMERTPEEAQLAAQAKADREASRDAVKRDIAASRQAVRSQAQNLRFSWNTMFQGAPEMAEAKGILRATTGAMAAQYEQAAFKLDEFRRLINPLSDTNRLNLIDAIETGSYRNPSGLGAVSEGKPGALNEGPRQADQYYGDDKELRSAFLDGFGKGDTRQSLVDPGMSKSNPYREGTPHWTAWEQGFTQAYDPSQVGSGLPRGAHLTPQGDIQVPQIDPEFHPFIDAIRGTLDGARDQIRALGTGKLDSFIEDYFPHIWEDPERATDVFRTMGAKGPLEGPAGFLKERSIPTTKEGIAQGLEPVSTNPIDLTLLKLREMQRYLMAHQSMSNLADAGLTKYVQTGGEIPDGFGRINDKIATVFGPRQGGVTLPEGASVIGGEGGIPAYHGSPNTELSSVSANPATRQYDNATSELGAFFSPTQKGAEHYAGKSGKVYPTTVPLRNPYEMRWRDFAHFQDIAKGADGAPVSFTEDGLTARAAELKAEARALRQKLEAAGHDGIIVRKPSGGIEEIASFRDVALGNAQPPLRPMDPSEVSVPGRRVMGEYWAPKPVADLLNNYLSPGLPATLQNWFPGPVGKGLALTADAWRGIGNTLNQAQLGFSAFHLGFTSLDATTSRTALGLEYLASGKPVEGFGKILTAPLAALPGIAQGIVGDAANHFLGTDIHMGLGAKIRQAYLNPESASLEMRAMANWVQEAGGRVQMDSYYKNGSIDKFWDAYHAGNPVGTVGHALPALMELASKPIMEHIVPLQKLQVFGEIALKAMRDLPSDASLAERRAALGSAWDSADNRMGQLVYDNLFWNKTFKDLAMLSTRSVGWNVGTIRELGGGLTDAVGSAKDLLTPNREAVLSHRTAYLAALPITVGMLGAAYQYLRTGQGPQELKDYFFPRTGDTDADGNPERVQLPSYMKDIFAYSSDPYSTVKHKLNPFPAMVADMLSNQDFYGDEIRNPHDPIVKQMQQESEYLWHTVQPFGIRNAVESSQRGDNLTTQLNSMIGITPAKRADVRTPAENLMADYAKEHGSGGATPEMVEARQQRAAILAGLRGSKGVDLEAAVNTALQSGNLTPPQLARLLKRAGMTPDQERFKALPLDEALAVFKIANPREQAKFAESLAKKLDKAGR